MKERDSANEIKNKRERDSVKEIEREREREGGTLIVYVKNEKAASAAYVKSDVGRYRLIYLLRSLPKSAGKH